MQLHEPLRIATPSQRLAAVAHNMRLAKIAEKAGSVIPRRVVTFSIPNTPFGIPKIRPYQPKPLYIGAPEHYYQFMWFHDLVFGADREKERVLSVAGIARAVAGHFGISLTELLADRRDRRIVRPRQLAMYLAKKLTLRSLPDIGRKFGGRDHTTVLHAVCLIESLLLTDLKMAADMNAIKARVQA